MIGIICFAISVFFMILGHNFKVLRWKQFIDVYEKTNYTNLLRILSTGHIINVIIPFRIGDIVRIYLSGKKLKNGYALAIATVIVDIYMDILTVGLVFLIFLFNPNLSPKVIIMAKVYIVLSIFVIFISIIATKYSTFVKKVIYSVASIFNSKIELAILFTSWTSIYSLKNMYKKLDKKRLYLYTVLIWASYFCSYTFFAEYISIEKIKISTLDVFTTIFSSNILKDFINDIQGIDLYYFSFLLYMIIPLILIFTFTKLYRKKFKNKKEDENFRYILPQLNKNEKLSFLQMYFTSDNKEYIQTYLDINKEINIIRDYSAGSNATTMLCIDKEQTFFRKYAFGLDGEKLYEQMQWINQHQKMLPLPLILRHQKTETYCYYDMPYETNAVGFFHYIHSRPLEDSWNIMRKVLKNLEGTIYQHNVKNADIQKIQEYIHTKVTKNLMIMRENKRIKNLLEYQKIIINGVEYENLNYYNKYFTIENLTKIFKNDIYADIHGDLTIENIICTKNKNNEDDFYIIDPNTGNIHNSPNLDYGKLLQSIHGGYEFLMATKQISVTENKINFLFTKSSAYINLYKKLKEYIEENFSKQRVQSIYFHEVIHWLRLMPYKIEKDGERVLLFYAGLLIILQDIKEMFGKYIK